MVKLLAVITLSVFGFSLTNAQENLNTKIMVLGSPHLQQMKGVETSYLTDLLERLDVEEFDAIAVEKMPVELLLDIKKRPEKHWQELYAEFKASIEFGENYQKKINRTFAEAAEILKDIKSKIIITDADRIEFIKSYLCMYDVWSACLHFKLLQNTSLIDTDANSYLTKLSKSLNEINVVGLEIAKNRKHSQIYYIDNLQDEIILQSEFPAFFREYEASQTKINDYIKKSSLLKKIDTVQSQSIASGNLLTLYQFYNSEYFMEEDFNMQWELWFKTFFPSKSDISRYFLWEMRNLQITANILRVAAGNPGKKILVLIGASHKSFIEKYLKQIPNVELINFN